jgi:hypothetical protein
MFHVLRVEAAAFIDRDEDGAIDRDDRHWSERGSSGRSATSDRPTTAAARACAARTVTTYALGQNRTVRCPRQDLRRERERVNRRVGRRDITTPSRRIRLAT